MLMDVGMAVPKTTETIYRDGSDQDIQVTYIIPSKCSLLRRSHIIAYRIAWIKMMLGWGYLCSLCISCLAWHCHPYI